MSLSGCLLDLERASAPRLYRFLTPLPSKEDLANCLNIARSEKAFSKETILVLHFPHVSWEQVIWWGLWNIQEDTDSRSPPLLLNRATATCLLILVLHNLHTLMSAMAKKNTTIIIVLWWRLQKLWCNRNVTRVLCDQNDASAKTVETRLSFLSFLPREPSGWEPGNEAK